MITDALDITVRENAEFDMFMDTADMVEPKFVSVVDADGAIHCSVHFNPVLPQPGMQHSTLARGLLQQVMTDATLPPMGDHRYPLANLPREMTDNILGGGKIVGYPNQNQWTARWGSATLLEAIHREQPRDPRLAKGIPLALRDWIRRRMGSMKQFVCDADWKE